MGAFLLAVLLAAPAADQPWGLVNVALDGGAWSANGGSSKNGTATLGLTWYSPTIADDGAPLSLQPYLQRLSTLNVSAAFGGYSTSTSFGPDSFSGATILFGAAGNKYLTESFAITAAASLQSWSESGPLPTTPSVTYLLPAIAAGPAVRFGDTRLDLFYRWNPVIRDGNYDGKGRIYLNGETVIERQVSLNVQTHTLPSGLSLHGGFAAYLDQRLQIGAGITYANGEVYFDSRRIYSQLTPSVDLAYWFTRAVRASISYALVHTSAQSNGAVTFDENRLGMTLGVRLD